MKKLLLILFASLCLSAHAQTPLDIGAQYSRARLEEIHTYIDSILNKNYVLYSEYSKYTDGLHGIGEGKYEYKFSLANRTEGRTIFITTEWYSAHAGDTVLTKIKIHSRTSQAMIDSIYDLTFNPDKNPKVKENLVPNNDPYLQIGLLIRTSNKQYHEFVKRYGITGPELWIESVEASTIKAPVKPVWTKADEELYGSQAEKVHQDMIGRQSGHSLVRIIGFKEYYTNEISTYLQQKGYTLEDSPDKKGSFNYVFSPSYIGTQKAIKLRMNFIVNQKYRVTSGTITGSFFDLANLFLYYWPQSAEWWSQAQLKRGVVAQKHNFGDLITFNWNGATPFIKITKDPNISMPVPPLKK